MIKSYVENSEIDLIIYCKILITVDDIFIGTK